MEDIASQTEDAKSATQHVRISKKRVREPGQVNVALVEIYEDLAHEDEEIRRKAAGSLLKNITPTADLDQTRTILSRLFRGLCSGRKAARLGFAVALTEMLYQLKIKLSEQPHETISTSELIDILERQTSAEGNTSGQDERDHYFGRSFGCEAIIRSEILFTTQEIREWDRLLDVICGIANKKSWLREECGWILFNGAKALKGKEREVHAVRILEKLTEHRLIRCPEGLAIWLAVQRLHSGAHLPKSIWKDSNPLSEKNLSTLADVLKNIKVASKDEEGLEVQGSTVWAANLHFAWEVVIMDLTTKADDDDMAQVVLARNFWRVAVDEALFSKNSTPERKHGGFLVVRKTLEKNLGSTLMLPIVFSKNVVHCLITSLKSPDMYLQRSAQDVIQTLHNCVKKSPEIAHIYVVGLLRATDNDFDNLSKTKTINDLLRNGDFQAASGSAVALSYELGQAGSSDPIETARKRKLLLSYQLTMLCQQVRSAISNNAKTNESVISSILHSWIEFSFGRSDFDQPMKVLVRGKLQLAFVQVLKLGRRGRNLMLDLVGEIYRYDSTELAGAEPEILSIIKTGWTRFERLHDMTSEDDQHGEANGSTKSKNARSNTFKNSETTVTEALALLYALILFEIHSGDTEAIQILQELLTHEAANTVDDESRIGVSQNADALIEILLSFASRPSKFLRQLVDTIFETFTSQITRDGLRSLTDILEIEETQAGQQELFEAGGGDEMLDESVSEDDEEASDVEMLDSDVEVVSASNAGSDSSDTTSEKSEDSASDNDEADADNADLFALDAALASALGTRALTQDDKASDSSSDSDSDMTDSEMMALDEKLAEVFRNRAKESNESKKKQAKEAKENMVHFKNRVLDMLDVYVRQEHSNSRCLEILLPLLQLARRTVGEQLGFKAINILQNFCKKCAGKQNVPVLAPASTAVNGKSDKSEDNNSLNQGPITIGKSKSKSKSKDKGKKPPSPPSSSSDSSSDSDSESESTSDTTPPTPTPDFTPTTLLPLLRQIHTEAGLPKAKTFEAHRTTSSRLSIILAKTLLKAGVPLSQLADVYATTERQMEEKTWKGEKKFLDDWVLWRKTVEGRI